MAPTDTDQEQHLLRLARQNDPTAMELIYSTYVRYLAAVCSRYIINSEDVKDVLQDSFLIRQLPDGYRTIFNLYVIENKSHKEIASLLNIKESTSASQLHRAKSLLAMKIRQYKH